MSFLPRVHDTTAGAHCKKKGDIQTSPRAFVSFNVAFYSNSIMGGFRNPPKVSPIYTDHLISIEGGQNPEIGEGCFGLETSAWSCHLTNQILDF